MGKVELSLDKAVQVMKLLSDKTRLTMMKLMQHSEHCVCEFVELFDTSQPGISQHLRKLKKAGLVKETRRGHWVFYSVNEDHPGFYFVQTILDGLPDQDYRINELEKQGKRIICE